MDDQTRATLVTRLSEAKERQFQLGLRLRAHTDSIEEIRKTLGNPFFYSGRPEGDPESKSQYTGYASHEPALQLMSEYQEVTKEVESIQGQLRDAEFDQD
jgi:hypothetical protein